MLKIKENVLFPDDKAKIYELFANIFSIEPGVDFLELLQLEENEEIFRSYELDPFSDIRHLSIEQQAETLAIEYARLFLAPGRLASPYESMQCGENRLWGKTTVEVNKIYKKFGFELDEDFKDPPDHLSVELSFLAQLSRLENKYTSKGLIEERAGVLEVKKFFLKNHVLNWFTRFKDDVNQNAELSYYKDTVNLLDVFLSEENKGLNSVNDLSLS